MEDELLALKGDKKIPLKILFKRTMHYVRPEILSFIIAFVLLIANVLLDLYLPIIFSNIIDMIYTA